MDRVKGIRDKEPPSVRGREKIEFDPDLLTYLEGDKRPDPWRIRIARFLAALRRRFPHGRSA